MRKILIITLVLLSFAGIAWADSYQSITVDNTSGGVALSATYYLNARYAMCRLETAEIRYTKDGTTAPTDAVGILMEPLEFIILENPNQIKNFRGFRTTGTSGSLKCFFMKD